jgi:hypothetical protein
MKNFNEKKTGVRIMNKKKPLAVLLAVLLILGPLSVLNADNAIGATIPDKYIIITNDDMETPRPEALQEGQIWTGKSVEHHEDGTVTVTLSAWGAMYNNDQLPLGSGSNANVTIIDDLREFSLRSINGGVGDLIESGGIVTWTVGQSDIIGDSPASISYVIHLRDKDWRPHHWYSTGAAGAVYRFTPTITNPFYYTKEEITTAAFLMDPFSWNNGGINEGNIHDEILGVTLLLSKNETPYSWTSDGAHITATRNNNFRVGQTFDWFYTWSDSSIARTITITIRNLEGPGMDVAYDILMPPRGGNNFYVSDRHLVSTAFFQRHFEPGNQDRPFIWDGNSIVNNLEIIAQVQLRDVELNNDTGTLQVNKVLPGGYAIEWDVGGETTFTAVLWDESGEFLQFRHVEGNSFEFTGTTITQNPETIITFSFAEPAILTNMLVDTTIFPQVPQTYFIREIFGSPEMESRIDIIYRDSNGDDIGVVLEGSGIMAGQFQITKDTTTEIVIENDFDHGVGFLEISKGLQGFAHDHRVTENTVFNVRVLSVDHDHYLLFVPTENPGHFRHVGNHVEGLYEEIDLSMETPVMELPLSWYQALVLEDVFALGRYKVEEVVTNSPNPPEYKWKTFWSNIDFDHTPILPGEIWDGYEWFTENWLPLWELVPEVTPGWANDPNILWGVQYSPNNGIRQLTFDNTIFISVTNHYKPPRGSIILRKELDGYYRDWGVRRNTPFFARIWEIPDISMPNEKNLLLFQEIHVQGGTIEYNLIGYRNAFGEDILLEGVNPNDINLPVTVINFSYYEPSELFGLPFGRDKHYFVEEFFEETRHTNNISVEFTEPYGVARLVSTESRGTIINPVDDSFSPTITIVNNFTSTNNYKQIEKELEGHWRDWGVDEFTVFHAQVFHTATTDAALYFVFDNSNNTFKYVPYYEIDNHSHESLITDIPFSVATPAVLAGLDRGLEYIYKEVNAGNVWEDGFVSAPRVVTDEQTGNITNVIITNTFRHNFGQITIYNELVNHPRGVNENTLFETTVRDVTDSYNLLFILEDENTNTWRHVGNRTDGMDPRIRNENVHEKIQFSVNKPALLTNLWGGRMYAVNEVISGNYEFATERTPAQSQMMWGGDELKVTITKTFVSEYDVIYRGNNAHQGTPPRTIAYRQDDTVVVRFQYSLLKEGFLFAGWNTMADGTGAHYFPGDTFTMPAHDVFLYAQWEQIDESPIEDTPIEPPLPPPTEPPEEEESTYPIEPHEPPKPPEDNDNETNEDEDIDTPVEHEDADVDEPPMYIPPPPMPELPRPGHFFTEEHIWFIRGDNYTNIRPDGSTSRADAAMVFYRLLRPELKLDPPPNPFTDVSGNEWFGRAVGTLARYGIIEGYPDGSFKPHEPITRSEFAAIVSRFDNLVETQVNPYTDLDPNNWAYKYILSATARGWFMGHNGMFRPGDNLTRAEMVTAVNRVLRRRIRLQDIPPNVLRFQDIDENHWAFTDIIEASHTHAFIRKEDGIMELWIEIIETGIDTPYDS